MTDRKQMSEKDEEKERKRNYVLFLDDSKIDEWYVIFIIFSKLDKVLRYIYFPFKLNKVIRFVYFFFLNMK